VAADRLVYFLFGSPDLVVQESRAKANNLDAAEAKALAEAGRQGLAVLAYKRSDRVFIDLKKLLPHGVNQNFFAPPAQPINGPLKLLDVTHKGDTWELILQGQWQEKITLDDKYQVISTARIN
jgi:hypothetical protein